MRGLERLHGGKGAGACDQVDGAGIKMYARNQA